MCDKNEIVQYRNTPENSGEEYLASISCITLGFKKRGIGPLFMGKNHCIFIENVKRIARGYLNK